MPTGTALVIASASATGIAEAPLASDIAAANTAVAANIFARFDMLLLHRSCRLAAIIRHSPRLK
jgi:hypothetical protein